VASNSILLTVLGQNGDVSHWDDYMMIVTGIVSHWDGRWHKLRHSLFLLKTAQTYDLDTSDMVIVVLVLVLVQ